MINLLLADDDEDDCSFFEEALGELALSVALTTVCDGERLMQFLNTEADPLPHVLFLDLNIPRKNGMECLLEIKSSKKLEDLSVIIFTTSSEQYMVNALFDKGALYYIRKPAEFSQLKKVIQQALTLVAIPITSGAGSHRRDEFVLTGNT
jgi:CheY-like chemotaxis protein